MVGRTFGVYEMRHEMKKLVHVVAVVTGSVASLPGVADWNMEPYAKMSLVLDDNIRFRNDEKKGLGGLITDLGVVIRNETEAVTTRVEPRISYRSYPADSAFNSFDQFLNLSTMTQGERSDLGLALTFANDTTLTSELEDSGVIYLNKRRTYFSMAPSWRYLLSPLTSIKVQYRFDGSQYEDSGENGLNDFEYQVMTADYERRLSEDSEFVLRTYYQRYKVIELTNKAKSLGGELGYQKRFSPRLEGRFFVGAVNTESTVAGIDESSTGVSAKVNVLFTSETAKYSVEYGAGVVPSSTGVVFSENRLTGRVASNFSEKLSWHVDLLAQTREPLVADSAGIDRTYYRLSPGINWQLNKNWRATASYTFSEQSRDDLGGDAVRNQVYMGVEYRNPKRMIY